MGTDSRKEPTDEEMTSNVSSLSSENQEQGIKEAIVEAFDEASDDTQKAVNEAKKDIPRFTDAIAKYQEKMLETSREIAQDHIASQKEIINLFQKSAWMSKFKGTDETVWQLWISSKWMTEVYTKMINIYVDNLIAGLGLSNNLLSINMEIYKTFLQQIKANETVFLRLALDNARISEKAMKQFSSLKAPTEKEIHKPQ